MVMFHGNYEIIQNIIILNYETNSYYTGVCVMHLNDRYITANIGTLIQRLEMKLLLLFF